MATFMGKARVQLGEAARWSMGADLRQEAPWYFDRMVNKLAFVFILCTPILRALRSPYYLILVNADEASL